MSIAVMTWAWSSSRASGADLLVLLAIADHAHDDGDGAYPSVPALARKARVSDRSVQRCIKSLVELGELVVRQNAGPNGVNVYRVVMGRQVVTPSDSVPANTGRQSATPDNLSPRHSRRSGVTPTTPSGDTRVTQTVREPSLTEREPSPFCNRHPSGTDDACGACGTAKRRFERWRNDQPARAAAALARRRACPRCHGDGWLLDDTGQPAGRCDHQLEFESTTPTEPRTA